MHELYLHNEIPDEATTIEIYAMVKPARRSIEAQRSLDNDQPILISTGARTTIGVLKGRKLYISASPFTEGSKLFGAGGFQDRGEQQHDD